MMHIIITLNLNQLENILYKITEYLPDFFGRIYLIAGIFTFFILFNLILGLYKTGVFNSLASFIDKILNKIFKINKKEKKDKPVKKKNIWKRILQISIYILINIFTIILFLAILLPTILIRPTIISSTPDFGSNLITIKDPVEIYFNLPINTKDIKYSVVPESTNGDLVFEDYVFGTSYALKAKYITTESIYPDTKVVIYFSNLTRILPEGDKHEEPFEFFSVKSPEISTTTPSNNGINVKPKDTIKLYLSSHNGEQFKWTFITKPEFEYSVNFEDSKIIEIIPKEDLLQDTTYTVDSFYISRSLDLTTGEEIKVGTTTLATSTTFTTVATPNIQSKKPEGESVLPDSNIEVKFNNEMNRGSVIKAFSITPEIDGGFSWSDDYTMIFTPSYPLPKDTEFTINFSSNIETSYGGKIKDPITFKFKTIGKVRVNEMIPYNGVTGLDPNLTNIYIKFNQEVDRQSAQDHFYINPYANGTFQWDGNTMQYLTAGRLNYNITYDYGVTPGVKTIYGIDSDENFISSFRTSERIIYLNVPLYWQPRSGDGAFSCNTYAASMALSYRGIYYSPDTMRYDIGYGVDPEYSWVPWYGTHAPTIYNRIVASGRGAEIHYGWNSIGVAEAVEAGNPVIIWRYNGVSSGNVDPCGSSYCYRGMHSGVVVGFYGYSNDPYIFIINDPWFGQLYMTRWEFESYWAFMGNTAIVVY